MIKRTASLMLAVIMLSGCLFAAGTENFVLRRTYEKEFFKDVVPGSWYEADVARAYELGLIDGHGGGIFGTTESISIAQTVTLACRLHSIYNSGSADFTPSVPWYDVYFEYALRFGIITEEMTENHSRIASRREFAKILSAAMPADALPAINEIELIPDVENIPENEFIYRLYRAGILKGSDKYGTFRPDSDIKRNEVAAILARLASPESRVHFTLGKMPLISDYLDRVLSDAELADLKDASLSELRTSFSTVGDVIAYLDSFGQYFYSADHLGLDISIDDYLRKARNTHTCSEFYTFISAYCIADDFTGVKVVIGGIGEEQTKTGEYGFWPITGLALPTEGGYCIYSPGAYSELKDQGSNLCAFETVTVSDLTELEKHLSPVQIGSGSRFFQIYTMDASDMRGRFISDSKRGLIQESGSGALVYEISAEEIERLNSDAAEMRWDTMLRNLERFALPECMAPTIDRETAEALVGKSIEEVAAAVKTLGDCMYYYCASDFQAIGGDLQTSGGGSLVWHYNYIPEVTFSHNYGCCGSISGLTAYLLQGDYEVMGIIGMTFLEGEGGGHVINYITEGENSYVFDMINWISSNYGKNLLFTSGRDLKETALKWSDESPWSEKLMYAYISFDGDAPVGWKWDAFPDNSLPLRYKDSAVIIMETPSEGYTYTWVEIPEDVWREITDVRTTY